MRIETVLKQLQERGITLTSEEERVLNDTFGACDRIDSIIRFSRELIIKSLSLDSQFFILHSDGNMNKSAPEGDEIFFGVYINTLWKTSYIIILPA